MTDISANNKRIAKNTLYMYFRMGITLIISILTARIVLNALGVHDYGLYNVVGGFVGMLGFFNGLLSQGTTRFLTIGLGKGDMVALKHTFSACLTIHLILALIILCIGETVGLWFVNNKLVIDSERLSAANVVYQLSLFSSFLGIMQVPYSASIISHERMGIYAYMSIFGVAMKLVAICLLLYMGGDKLIILSTFYFIIHILVWVFYRWYCIRNFEECTLKLGYDKKLYREIFNYVGWNAIGSFAFMGNNQGVTVLLNLFFGTAVNTARGLAQAISGYVNQFVSNFQVAVTPQIMKYHASGQDGQMNHLIINNCKYSSYLLMLMGIPVFLEAEFIMRLWLGQVPEYTVPFVRITLVQMMVQAIDFPIGYGIHAFGKMKLPNLTSSLVYLSGLPVCYLLLRAGLSPVAAYIVIMSVYPMALVADLWVLHKYSGFDRVHYFKAVVCKTVLFIVAAVVIPCMIHLHLSEGWVRFISVGCSSLAISSAIIYRFGLSVPMRRKVVQTIMSKLHAIHF